MIIRIATLLLLCSASLPLLAADEHVLVQGDGDCPPAMVDEREAPDGTVAHDGDADAATRDKASQPASGGGGENSVRSPRMHNLLPGMFR